MALLPFSEAKSRLLASACPVSEIESLDLAHAFGQVLARDLVSPMTVPPFSNAAMDGYAVRAADVMESGQYLAVSQRVAAGDVARPHVLGTAARIFTGAQLPEGADAVVMQEDCVAEGEGVVVNQVPAAGQHVRLKGSDLVEGKTILPAGRPISFKPAPFTRAKTSRACCAPSMRSKPPPALR